MKKVAKNQVVASIELLKDQAKEMNELHELLKDAMNLPEQHLRHLNIARTGINNAVIELTELVKLLGNIAVVNEEPEMLVDPIAKGVLKLDPKRNLSEDYIEVQSFINKCRVDDVIPAGKFSGVVSSQFEHLHNAVREALLIGPGSIIAFLEIGEKRYEVLSVETKRTFVIEGLQDVDLYIALCEMPKYQYLIDDHGTSM